MNYWLQILRHYPLSSLFIVVIWVVCLIPIPDIPLAHVSFIDKWTHIALYLVLGLTIWGEYLYRHKKASGKRLFLLAFLAPLVMGGLIEIAQATLTGGTRNGDWLDFAADAVGVVLAQVIGIVVAKCLARV